MSDWGPVFVSVVLFILLTPGLLIQVPGRNRFVEFGNFQTSDPTGYWQGCSLMKQSGSVMFPPSVSKAKRLSHNFKELLGKYGEEEVPKKEMVEELMKDTLKDEESRLPDIRSPDYELKASSIFVDFDTPLGRYGTRSIAALSVTASGKVSFYEEYLEKETWKVHTIDHR